MLTTCESIYWTSMFIMNHYNSYYWTSMPVLSQFEKLFYVLSHPMGLLFWKNDDLWKFGTCPFSKKMCISLFWKFPKNVSLNFQVTATAAAATVVSQEPSPFGLALGVYHAQGQNIPCGESFLDVTYTMHICQCKRHVDLPWLGLYLTYVMQIFFECLTMGRTDKSQEHS